MKMVALKARMMSGSIWGACSVNFDVDGNAPWTYNIRDDNGNGYLISVIEFQQRGMPHAHIVLKVSVNIYIYVIVQVGSVFLT